MSTNTSKVGGSKRATIGCEGLVIVRTRDATLVCPAALAERVKEIAGLVPPEAR